MSASDGTAASRALAELGRTAAILIGRPLDEAAAGQFEQYLELLVSWSKVQRLTGFDSPDSIVTGLMRDSLLFMPLLPVGPISVVDIGSGAGIPGIPLRIARPDIALTMVEARQKRVSFLRTVRRTLGLRNVDVVEGRAEGLVSAHPDLIGRFDAAVSRAVRPTRPLLAAVRRCLKPGARFVIGGPAGADGAVELPSGVQVDVRHYRDIGLTRAFWIAS